MSTRAERSRAEAADELLTGPIVGELLGADHLAARARAVARDQRLVATRTPLRPARLLARLSETRRILTDAQERLLSAAAAGVDAGPAAEWLLDNYHVVQEHLQEVRASLPGGYYRELPELASGPMTGYPRVYEMAISLISHTEARVDLENVDLYVESFQSVTPLSVGELWAMPAMLRLGLIESVRRMTLRTMQRLDEIGLASMWSDRVLAASARGGTALRESLREFADADHELTPHFVSRFLQLLRQTEGASPPLAWLEHWMRDAGVSPETSVALSTHRVTLTGLMMANSITSLRDIGRRDWRHFVEKQSVIEAVLRTDPAGFYAQMTFATRDRYRHVVERIAKSTGHREMSVAQWAIDLAQRPPAAEDREPAEVRTHVGFYLIDDGIGELEALAGYSPTIAEKIERTVHAHPNAVFVGGLTVLVMLVTLGVMLLIESDAPQSMILLLLLAFFPALDIAVTVLNQLVTALLPPHTLPRLDLHEHGVPEAFRTAVVIPTLFARVEDVRDALETLEVQFLANREAHLHFAVLSDFTDAAHETITGDDAIVAAARDGIGELNARHAGTGSGPFHLLHRSRRWNPTQGVWMGWERKRGKLSDFNRLVRGHATDAFSTMVGDTDALLGVKYVITLDADTVLPPDAAPSLVGALAHPLNRPVYDAERGMLRGYGILQPRVGVSLPSAHRSRFAAIASGHPGVDPYSTAVSDVYQDLFGEGTFTGKGIYDVDAFQMATHGRFPENTLLSHDLIEGNYARAGLATDVIVYDDYPSTYIAYTRRKHRWIRGDWQLLPWLRRTVPGPDGPERNRLSLVSQWKIIDNLRRSMVEISQLLFLIGGWTILPGSALRWTMLGLGAIVAPWVTALIIAILRPPLDKSWRAYYEAVAQDAVVSVEQALVAILTLPHQALISADAIVRTLHRLFVSRRMMLEWQSALLVERSLSDIGRVTRRSMQPSAWIVGLGAVAIVLNALGRQRTLGLPVESLQLTAFAVGLMTACWMMAPPILAYISQPSGTRRQTLTAAQRDLAVRYAALHWHFFDTFVTEETHWLAPDNFQSDPEPVVAMRTSPTNMGLQLLATISACDLKLIDAADMTSRLELTFGTFATLRRYRGHFYNWYDLSDLRVLDPPYISTVDSGNLAGHLIAVRQACLAMADAEPTLRTRLQAIADAAYSFVTEMDFSFLYESERKLFTIGYHPESFTPDDSYYDLLASEARLASFMAIGRNDVPVEHWFRLSRTLSRTAGTTALVSWSGSMFEYLMPVLVMRSLPFTLLAQTYRGVVERHVAYARSRSVPWGVSESAYNLRDRHQTYQYRAFGIPDLALKRGLGRDLVIAPYATALAAQIDPPRALGNLKTLESMGALGEYGFCDALDYTRPAQGAKVSFVRAYMAHHIGMTLVSLTNVLLHDIWQARFHADSLVKSVELLLHERIPRRLVMQDVQAVLPDETRETAESDRPVVREINTSLPSAPRVALLGSHPYTVMLNHNGSGYSRYESIAVTRWRADSTRDDTGQFCYINDLTAGRMWSSAYQPFGVPASHSRAWLASDRATLHRIDGDIETRTEITVVPADSAEVRRVTLTNTGSEPHEVELTSYGEVAMNTQGADLAHPAFSNLFVETEWHGWCTAITATRRPRSPDDPRLWCVHVVDAGRDRLGSVSCETDRARFIGRGHTVRDPIAMTTSGELSGTTGPVLDPIFSLRTRVSVAPGQSVTVAFTTLVATTREAAFELAGRYHDSHAAQRALDFAWTATQIELRELGITPANAAVFQEIAAQLLYLGGSLAPPHDELRRSKGSQPLLWAHGISGDNPIVLANIESIDGLPTLRELFSAHRYWRRRGLTVDLVVINSQPYDYLQELRDGITEAMVASNDASLMDRAGGTFIRRREQFPAADFLMLSATARVHIACDGRALTRVLANAESKTIDVPSAIPSLVTTRAIDRVAPASNPVSERPGPLASFVSAFLPLVAPLLPRPRLLRAGQLTAASDDGALRFDNGIGGLDSRDNYRIEVRDGTLPPAPWANVIANPHGGFLVTERGAGCTWAENAYFYRLTPWHNDPVSDPISDAIYLQDDDSDDLWSATPAPVDGSGTYRVTHGAGQSTFVHERREIRTQLRLSVPPDAAVKLSVLRITNMSAVTRQLTVTAYAEWTLGARRDESQFQVRTRFVPEHGAIFAHNHFDPLFTNWTAFLASSEPVTSHTADRLTFLGRNGHHAAPAALRSGELDGASGVGLDPCAALQMRITLLPGESRDVTILLGAAPSEVDARRLIDQLRPVASASAASSATVAEWDARLSTITVATPDIAFNAMINRWSLYQALSCRMWARMGLYQSSGAYGFRDQLQDSMAFLYAEPQVAREHILRAAARQFVEGDVQHWWHAHSGRGVRTRFSDDLAWLPFVVDQYVTVTGDRALLDEYVPFITMRTLGPSEHELYELPTVTEEHGSIYEHCRRALRRACTAGPHGLPLIGTGDWNDGMSRVGAEGRGESVWLAWFLIRTMRAFAKHADARGDDAEARHMREWSDRYAAACEEAGWDGAWYRRAYYDNGLPIGSASSEECQIDSIAQSWSVISGAAPVARQEMAMQAFDTQLVRSDARLIELLTPPFGGSDTDPGYIRGYLPGVRENGGQYTHAALWAVLATAMQGDADRAFELFQMLNPLTHSATPDAVATYKVEPYVVAADVYSSPSHLGRGGWTWYTGSASWMYRVGLEDLLGFTKVGDTLRIAPCVPSGWPAYQITYRFGRATYVIDVRNPAGIRVSGARVSLDGVRLMSGLIPLIDDGKSHRVVVEPESHSN
ncbi:MAG: carbohydrate-binding protein [Gemmatimonadaceae bacterium]|nr:carbohydrate-binding protein [Gemmatimonadaceae bacterium]